MLTLAPHNPSAGITGALDEIFMVEDTDTEGSESEGSERAAPRHTDSGHLTLASPRVSASGKQAGSSSLEVRRQQRRGWREQPGRPSDGEGGAEEEDGGESDDEAEEEEGEEGRAGGRRRWGGILGGTALGNIPFISSLLSRGNTEEEEDDAARARREVLAARWCRRPGSSPAAGLPWPGACGGATSRPPRPATTSRNRL